mgnify:CR=1 FL=1
MPHKAQTLTRDFLTVSQAADRLQLAERTIIKYIGNGTIRAEKLEPEKPNSVWIIPLAEIEKYEKENE